MRKRITTQSKAGSQKQSVPGNCHNCGTVHPKRKCPAYGKKCLNCGKFNHFAKWCKSRKKIDTLSKKEEVEDLRFISAFGKGRLHSSENECFLNLEIHGLSIRLKIDTGSQANILPRRIFIKLRNKPELQQSSTKQTTYSGDTLSIVGRCNLSCQDNNLEFFKVKTNQDPILSFKASQDLGLIKVVLSVEKTDKIVAQYQQLFKGLGCLKTSYHIKTDPEICLTICPPRNH